MDPAHTEDNGHTSSTAAAPTYVSALINPPPHTDPKLVAREGIRARQFLIMEVSRSAEGGMGMQLLKADMNKALRELGAVDGKIRSVVAQRDGSSLIEGDSDYLAKWLTNVVNRVEFCSRLGEGVTFQSRVYSVLAFNAPLTIDLDDPTHREEVNEANELKDGEISVLRWAKPIERRSQHQRLAHLVLLFSSLEVANQVIASRAIICNKKCHVERIKKELIQCLKCQGWNHMTKECLATLDRCSNCAGKHKTATCCQLRTTRCMSYNSNNHVSWSRECPSLLKRVIDFNERNPENSLPFFPTSDPRVMLTPLTSQAETVPLGKPTPNLK